ncbi:MAG: hypothetical protein ABMA64_03070 [Myxococcota bacterium]|jgi:hypothetical protein
MKFDAHPLVVAVALGLLGPGALVEEERGEGCDSPLRCEGEWEPGEAPSADEFHRVELEWLKQA